LTEFPYESQWKTAMGHFAVVIGVEEDTGILTVWHSWDGKIKRHHKSGCRGGDSGRDLKKPWVDGIYRGKYKTSILDGVIEGHPVDPKDLEKFASLMRNEVIPAIEKAIQDRRDAGTKYFGQ